MRFIRLGYMFASRLGLFALIIILMAFATLTYAFEWNANPKPSLGIVYFYHEDETFTINSELERIKADGFQIVCIPYIWSNNPQSSRRVKTDFLFNKASQLGLKVYVRQPDSATLEQYLGVYAEKISYFQVINEADVKLLKEWFVPGELTTLASKNAETIKKFNPNIQTVASFTTPLFINLITSISEKVDIIALDIYEQIQLDTFPIQMQTMLTASNKKTIWIGEFGYATLNDEEQANFLIKGLNLFAKNGVSTVIIWGWKNNNGLNIKGRTAETAIRNWLMQP